MSDSERTALELLLLGAAATLMGPTAEYGLCVRLITGPTHRRILGHYDRVMDINADDAQARSLRRDFEQQQVGNHQPLDSQIDNNSANSLTPEDFQTLLSQWLTPDQVRIVSTVTTERLTAEKIAERCGFAYDSRLRLSLSLLVERGVLVSTPRGYQVAGPHVVRLLAFLPH